MPPMRGFSLRLKLSADCNLLPSYFLLLVLHLLSGGGLQDIRFTVSQWRRLAWSLTSSSDTTLPSMETSIRNVEAAAEAYKTQGNQAYGSKRFSEAVRLYTEAHNVLPNEPVFLSNRAAAHFETGDYAASLADDSAALALLDSADVTADVSKGLQLREKVLNRARRAALQRKEWGTCLRFCELLEKVEARLGRQHCVGAETHFGHYPVGHEDPDGLIGAFGAVDGTGIEPIPISELAELSSGEKLNVRLLFGACGDPRHVMQSFYELESHLTAQYNLEEGLEEWSEVGSEENLEEGSEEGLTADSGKASEKGTESDGEEGATLWEGVSLICDMNDLDVRILARNVLMLVLLRDVGTQPGCSEDGGAVLDKLRWQIKYVDMIETMEEGDSTKNVTRKYVKAWEDAHPGRDSNDYFSEDFFVGTHFQEQDVLSGELLYKVWLSCNLTAAESTALTETLNSLVAASRSLATWQTDPQLRWIEFPSEHSLAAARTLWRVWRDFGRTGGASVAPEGYKPQFDPFGRMRTEPEGFGRYKLRHMVAALRSDAPMMRMRNGRDEFNKGARVEMDSWRRTGVTASYADVMAGRTGLKGMPPNPTMLNEITPDGEFVAKDPADNPWNFGPESLFYNGGPFALAPNLRDLPDALRGFVGMTSLQFYIWAQALARLLGRGADVRVRVLCGDICEAAGGARERAGGGSPSDAPTAGDGADRNSLTGNHLKPPPATEPRQGQPVQVLTEDASTSSSQEAQRKVQSDGRTGVNPSPPHAYDRIHTTNVIDYVGPLNVLTGIGSQLKPDCRHVAIKTNVLLNLGLYLKPDSPTRVFDLDHWLRRELLLSRRELLDFLGYTVNVSPHDLADPTYLVPTLGTEPPLAGSARLAEWLEKTLVNVTLPLVTEEPRRTPGRGCSVLEPRGHTIATFVNLLRHLVERRGARAHWVAERTESALQRPEVWRTDLAVAVSLALPSLPFVPASPALFPLSSLVRHSLAVPLFPWAVIAGTFTGNPQLALVVIEPEKSNESLSPEDVKYQRMTDASGDRLRTMLTESRRGVHLFSSLVVRKPDKGHVSQVEVWLPKKWVDEGTGEALLLRIDRYEFVSRFAEL
ncbi:hypothetical protein KFL_001890170 [Klebsormidium nitens]|uniref:Uncharacterized protein n=1 Tax=Klebsormidium nitens TaxID=105231 RepID=A0A1Y1I1U9_KLENI|nr:hypothetical protein KFL_001890170 [Klebsormidium nitens]|eukprot:GAQ84453.1 hypothetical protein KFL_001890170 [Klebsormidium nitens]